MKAEAAARSLAPEEFAAAYQKRGGLANSRNLRSPGSIGFAANSPFERKFKLRYPQRTSGRMLRKFSPRKIIMTRMRTFRSLASFPVTLLSAIVLIFFGMTLPTAALGQQQLVYVGTYTDHGSKGIYAFHFDPDQGQLSSLGLAAETVAPSFLAAAPNGHFVYAVNEIQTFNGQPTGSVSAFAIQPGGQKLSLLNQVSSRGKDPAHIVIDGTGKFALVANYTSGSVAVLPLFPDGHLGDASAFAQHQGSSVNRDRQEGPHAHAAAFSPDNRFVIVADLGLDQLLEYPFDASKGTLGVTRVTKTHPGAGPRHLVFSSNGRFLYVINEMESTVVTYSYDPKTGALRELQSLSSLPKDFVAKSGVEETAAEIAIDPSGNYLFASNRGYDSIAVFAVDRKTGLLTLREIDSTQGKTPRHFAIDPSGKWLLAANEDSNQIVVFRIDQATGHLTPGKSIPVNSPVCVVFVPAR